MNQLRVRVDLRFVTVALVVWWALTSLRSSHSIFGEPTLRSLVRDGSFVAIVVIGATFGNHPMALRNVARGSASAILVLGLASLLVSLALLPEPARTSPGREVFGWQSPLSRNYGFDVPFDAVALLVPLFVPFYLFGLLYSGSSRRLRRESGIVLALSSVIFVLLFQARGMVAQVVLAAILMSFLVGRRKIGVAGAAVALIAAVLAGQQLLSADEISTNIRVRTYPAAVEHAFSDVRSVVTGVDEEIVMAEVLSDPGLSGATEGLSIAIHNFFLANLVTGGVISLLALLSVVGYAGFRLLRSDLTQPSTRILLVAFVLVLVEMNLEPLRANVIGAWLILGLALGLEGPRAKEVGHGLPASRATRWRRRAHSPA